MMNDLDKLKNAVWCQPGCEGRCEVCPMTLVADTILELEAARRVVEVATKFADWYVGASYDPIELKNELIEATDAYRDLTE